MAAVAMAAIALVTGCSPAETASESTTLGDAVLAISLQPQEHEFAAGVNEGFVVLVDADGTPREIRTGGMDQGRLAFADGELYYMDLNQGYFTGDSSTTIVPARTTDQIEGLFRITGGYVGVYNEGGNLASEFSDEYKYQVLHTARTPPSAQLRGVGGYSRALAACGDEVFGVAHDPAAVPGVLSLKRLHPSEQLIERVRFPTAMEFEGLEAPCREGTMYFLGIPTNPEMAPPPQPMLLFKWNVVSGKLTTVPLTDANGAPLLQSLDEKLLTRTDVGSLASETFYWFDGRGRVQSTDVDSGATTVVAETGYDAAAYQGLQVSFEHPGVMLALHQKNPPDPLVLSKWDLTSGEPTDIMAVQGVETNLQRILRDFSYWGDQAPCTPQAC